MLKSARGYISRLNKEVLPALWEDIEGVVITEHRGFGKAKAFAKGGMARPTQDERYDAVAVLFGQRRR
ncbi:MAG: hypothetical protein QGG34_02755 [SAR202 cluster bacterium]|nr:hypothetical protein [SAR202 cluster bacterium]MDP6302483.1 hypothetical protein [SAR202 cluster bacterium]MDP7103344.1 hypothetical protein [SAR202 cluster bacterium]